KLSFHFSSRVLEETSRLVLLRHGESEFNLKNLFCGWHDTPLSQLGIEQSRSIAAAKIVAAKLEIDKVYCSVLSRSQQSADLILKQMKSSYVPMVKDWRLSERHYGNLTGENKRDVANVYGEERVQSWRRGYDGTPPPIECSNRYYIDIKNNPAFKDVPINEFPLTESMRMCVERVKPAWEEIHRDIMTGTRPMIVAHGTVARALIKHIECLSDSEVEKVNIPNCVPIVYEFNKSTGEVVGGSTYLGDASYIEQMKKKVAAIGD
ncbi:hypothetical protein KR222_002440, partial [Zaprionus bogoriensis]